MTACLTLATGSRAGLEAPLNFGYYMVGRRKDCQIRPKSRSVSRHHCLLFNGDGRLKVCDLRSASGTYVNQQKLTPKKWVDLRDGDMLRCGKIHFRVSIETSRDDESATDPVGSRRDGGSHRDGGSLTPRQKKHPEQRDGGSHRDGDSRAGSMLVGDAWHDVDVADFLESADELDREARYRDIRSRQNRAESGEDGSPCNSDSDLDLFEDAFADQDSCLTVGPVVESLGKTGRHRGRKDNARGDHDAGVAPTDKGGTAAAASVGTGSHATVKAKLGPPIPARKSARFKSAKSKRVSGNYGLGRWKTVAAVLLVMVVVAFFGYQLHRFSSGQPVRVIENID